MMQTFYLCTLCIFSISNLLICVFCQQINDFTTYEISSTVFKDIRLNFGEVFWNHVKSSDVNLQNTFSECWKELRTTLSQSNDKESWGIKIQSFAGQFPDNYRNGTLTDLGNYDGCLNSKFSIPSSYCMAYFVPKLELMNIQKPENDINPSSIVEFNFNGGLTLKVGICVPEACSSFDIDRIYNRSLNSSNWIQSHPSRCEGKNILSQLRSFSLLQMMSLVFTSSLIILVLLAGLQDIRITVSGLSKAAGLLHSIFSPKHNFIELFSTFDEVRWRKLDLTRVISFQIVLIMHIMFWHILFAPSNITNRDDFIRFAQNPLAQPILNTNYFGALTSLGGFSSAVTIWRKTNRETKLIEYLGIITTRFLIIQPIVIATIFFEITASLFISGPGFLVFMETPSEACEKSFFYHILQIKSIMGKNLMCAPHLWSISTEFHLFILTVFLIYLYHHHRVLARLIGSFVTIIGFAYTVSIFYRLNLQPGFLVYPYKFGPTLRYSMDYYITTLSHLWIYICAVTYAMFMIEKLDQKIEKKILRISSSIFVLLFVLSLYSLGIFNVLEIKPNPMRSMVFILISNLTLVMFLGLTFALWADEGREMLMIEKKNQISSGSTHLPQDKNNNDANINQISAEITKNPGTRKIDLLQIALRFSRIAYFPHTIIILRHYSQAREPLDILSLGKLWKDFMVYLCVFGLVPIFHILFTGPYSRILRKLKSRERLSKKEA